MRLIDADAYCSFLREVSTRQHYETLLTNKDKYPTVADVIEEICCDLDGTSLNGFDNAPTVDTSFRELIAYECGQKSVEERSKGEWIFKHGSSRNWCSNCDMSFASNLCEGLEFSFCPNCGADMRGNV